MSVQPEAIAAQALLDYLRANLPAKVASVNASRFAVLTSALAGPFTVPAGATLKLSATGLEATPTSVSLTSGSRTAAQVAADIATAAVPGITASDDAWGRLVLTATTAPAAGTGSAVVVGSDDDGNGSSTGVNAVFGWAAGGEHVTLGVIESPSWRGVSDGWPMGGIADMGPGFWVVLGDRTTTQADPNPRKGLYNVTIKAEVWRPFSPNGPQHRTREAISSCLRCVRELLEAQDGRYLGRQATNDVQMTRTISTSISGSVTKDPANGLWFDVGTITLNVRVFQRPD